MTVFQIVLLKPEGFEFVESFRETMEAMQWGLQQLGYEAPIYVNTILPGALPIIFGGHHLSVEWAARLPADSILYNLEQLLPGYPWYQPHYLDLLRRYRVWDGDIESAHWLCKSGIAPRVIHVPTAFAPILQRIQPHEEPDIDVLFYGIQTERRVQVLRALGEVGLRVVALNNVWAGERDSWIARSRSVVGIHQHAGGRLEAARLVYLLANGIPVVSEVEHPQQCDPAFAGAFVPAGYDELVSSCQIVARRSSLRAHLAIVGRRAALAPALDARRIMAKALAMTGVQ